MIISTCSEPLHNEEFVKNIEDILKEKSIRFKTFHYSEISENDLQESDKIIITGTSLRDNKFIKDIKKFKWIKYYKKPVLGICAGMQIISLVFGAELKSKTEIGYFKENFTEEFLSLIGEHEVYHLHNNYAALPKNFKSFTDGKIPQAIKHFSKEIYGVLFHPEVRNEKLIEEFVNSHSKHRV
jgi:GMP synthase (glutamine-hydrolysing)